MTIHFYARKPGSAFVYLHDPAQSDPFAAVDDILMQVEVLLRRAPQEKDISMTRLLGKTFAINAPDAKAYTMDTTVTFNGSAVNSLSVFAGVPTGTNHVVIGSHGGVPTVADLPTDSKLCIFISGLKLENVRLDVGNAESVFNTLRGKVARDAVLWFGGCNIGANDAFCTLAAKASGCHVVAPVNALLPRHYPKRQVDMLDRFAAPKVFNPNGTLGEHFELCALQERLKFSVPV